MPKLNTLRFRSLPVSVAPGVIDRESNIIHNASIAQAVEATGHNLLFDSTTLQQIAALGNAKGNGVKSRYTHPGLSSDGLGKFLGRVKNFRVAGDKVVGDLHLSDLAFTSPDGDLGTYILDAAEKEPDAIGMSVVINVHSVWQKSDGEELPVDQNGRPKDATTKIPLARVTALYSSDIVDEPAANRDGLFSNALKGTNALAEQLFADIDYQLARLDVSPQRAYQFALNYFSARGVITSSATLPTIQGVKLMADETSPPLAADVASLPAVDTAPPMPAADRAAAPQPVSIQGRGSEWLTAIEQSGVAAMLAASGLPTVVQTRLARQSYQSPSQVELAITQARSELAALTEADVINLPGQPPRGQRLSGGETGMEFFQGVFDWMFGVSGAKLPPPSLRSSAEIYRQITGDVEWYGKFDPSRVAFASANTTTLADLSVNAMNKVMVNLYDGLAIYRWFEQLVVVQPNDGSLHDMAWIQFGGIANLSTVADGSSYTEAAVADTKESDSFTKYGNYVGITRKMLRNSLIGQIQAVPRALLIAAVRTRSANIAGIFTSNSGVGPTLDQDSVALFHTASHGNLATTAYGISSWKAARLECFVQTELGSSKRQGLWPKFWLGPADLYDKALIDFGYGAGAGGYTGTGNNDVNPYALSRAGDPRPIPIVVPEFTDANDWAYIADPVLAPIIQMSYSQSQQGGAHPLPELFTASVETGGLMFTNDTLPVKIRDEYAYGVATYRGIGKRNVA